MGDKGSGQSNPMEQYLLLAKQAKGAAASQLILQTLEASGVYVFGELLEMPNIKELGDSVEYRPYYQLLELFAFGLYEDYIKEASKYPDLSPVMLTKLRHLTLVSMATGQKSIPLSSIKTHLNLSSTRELEDLIIETIYADIIHGKLDQKNGILEVDYAIGRDIKLEDLPNIVSTLQAWCDTCDTMLAHIDQVIRQANLNKEQQINHQNTIEKKQPLEQLPPLSKLKKKLSGKRFGSSEEVMQIKESLKPQLRESEDSLALDRDSDKKRALKKSTKASYSKLWQKSS